MLKDRRDEPPAEDIAARALAFLAQDMDRLGRFLALSGLDPSSIRQVAGEPHFLPSVLDHLLTDERLLLEFAAAEHLRPETVAEARRRLGREPTTPD